MTAIPASINGVTVEFGEGVVNNTDPDLVEALQAIIRPDIVASCPLVKIYIKAISDHHTKKSEAKSRHNQHKAVDISRINGVKIGSGYPHDRPLSEIVDAIQDAFEKWPGARENYGPLFKHKHGKSHHVSGHKDHIHLSVD